MSYNIHLVVLLPALYNTVGLLSNHILASSVVRFYELYLRPSEWTLQAPVCRDSQSDLESVDTKASQKV